MSTQAFQDGWIFGFQETVERWEDRRHQEDYARTCETVWVLGMALTQRSQNPSTVAYAWGMLFGANAGHWYVGDNKQVKPIRRKRVAKRSNKHAR